MKNISSFRSIIKDFWRKGYFYIFLSSIMFLIFAINKNVGIYDWQKETAYFQYIKSSIASARSFPWFWWSKLDNIKYYPAISQTSSFISNPETMVFSPLILFLFFLDVLPFIKLLTIIHFLIGVIGSFLLKKRFAWNLQQFRIFLILFLFSPIIIQHLAVGYTPWLNLFFFPWLIFFLSSPKTLFKIFGTSMILGVILLEGGIHVFAWFSLIILLYSILFTFLQRKWKYLLHMICIFALSCCLSLVRIFATSQSFMGFQQSLQKGYNLINFTIWAITPTVLLQPLRGFFIEKVFMDVPSWDAGIFWGFSLIMLIILLINYRKYSRSVVCTPNNSFDKNISHVFLIASLILLVFSFSSIYKYMLLGLNFLFDVSFLESIEKYPFRFAIPAFQLFSIILATYSTEIFGSLNRAIKKLIAINFISRIYKFIKSFSLIGFILGFSTLLFATLGSSFILPLIHRTISRAYYGSGNFWISKMMESKNLFTLEDYILIINNLYKTMQIAIFVVTSILLLVFLILRYYRTIPHLIHEMLLFLPFLFVSITWLLLSISVPYSKYPEQKIIPPNLLIEPANIQVKMNVDSKSITLISDKNPQVEEYIFPDIKASDRKFLSVTTNNAMINTKDGSISIVPTNDQPITIEFKTQKYRIFFQITLLCWFIVVALLIFYKVKLSCHSRQQERLLKDKLL